MTKVDTTYVSNLLEIAERCTGHSGKLSALQGWAIGELVRINEEIKNPPVVEDEDEVEEDA